MTHHLLLKIILGLWAGAFILSYLPLMGFGLFYESKNTTSCPRFREATEVKDIVYAYVFLAFGKLFYFFSLK